MGERDDTSRVDPFAEADAYWAERNKPQGPLARSVIRRRPLVRYADRWECPYCRRAFARGGRQLIGRGGTEGFVKAGARLHVDSCYEIVLWTRGWYIAGNAYPEGEWLKPAADCPPSDVRRLNASIARARRRGFEPAAWLDDMPPDLTP